MSGNPDPWADYGSLTSDADPWADYGSLQPSAPPQDLEKLKAQAMAETGPTSGVDAYALMARLKDLPPVPGAIPQTGAQPTVFDTATESATQKTLGQLKMAGRALLGGNAATVGEKFAGAANLKALYDQLLPVYGHYPGVMEADKQNVETGQQMLEGLQDQQAERSRIASTQGPIGKAANKYGEMAGGMALTAPAMFAGPEFMAAAFGTEGALRGAAPGGTPLQVAGNAVAGGVTGAVTGALLPGVQKLGLTGSSLAFGGLSGAGAVAEDFTRRLLSGQVQDLPGELNNMRAVFGDGFVNGVMQDTLFKGVGIVSRLAGAVGRSSTKRAPLEATAPQASPAEAVPVAEQVATPEAAPPVALPEPLKAAEAQSQGVAPTEAASPQGGPSEAAIGAPEAVPAAEKVAPVVTPQALREYAISNGLQPPIEPEAPKAAESQGATPKDFESLQKRKAVAPAPEPAPEETGAAPVMAPKVAETPVPQAVRPAPEPAIEGQPRLIAPGAVHGDPTTLMVRGGKGYPATYALVDGRSLSVDTAEGQNRNTSSIVAKVGNMGEKFIPDAVVSDTPFAQDGPPTVLENGVVVGGNTRLRAIAHSANADPAVRAAYLATLKAKLPSFGIPADAADAMEQPVLVRVVARPGTAMEQAEMVAEINRPTTVPLSATEEAAQDALILPDGALDSFTQGENESFASAIRRPANAQARGTLITKLFPEIAAGTDIKARITPKMLKRMEGAVMAKALGFGRESKALDLMLESPDANVNTIRNALTNRAGILAKARAYQDTRLLEGDPMGDLAAAVEKYTALKDAGESPTDFAAQRQPSLYGEDATRAGLSDRAVAIVGTLDDLSRSRKQLQDFLTSYAEGVINAPDKRQTDLQFRLTKDGMAEFPARLVAEIQDPQGVGPHQKAQMKEKLLETLNDNAGTDELPNNSAVQTLDLDRLMAQVKSGQLELPPDGNIAATVVAPGVPQRWIDRGTGFLDLTAKGAERSQVPAAMVFPERAIVGRGGKLGEVHIDPKFDIRRAQFIVDGVKGLLSYEDMMRLLSGERTVPLSGPRGLSVEEAQAAVGKALKGAEAPAAVPVTVVRSKFDLPPDMLHDLSKVAHGRNHTQALYNDKYGVVIFASEHAMPEDVAVSVRHELGHALSDKAITPRRWEVIYHGAVHTPALAEDIADIKRVYAAQLAKLGRSGQRQLIAKELVARGAERLLKQQGAWTAPLRSAVAMVRNAVRPVLMRFGINLKLTDNDILGILAKGRRAFQNEAAGGPIALASKAPAEFRVKPDEKSEVLGKPDLNNRDPWTQKPMGLGQKFVDTMSNIKAKHLKAAGLENEAWWAGSIDVARERVVKALLGRLTPRPGDIKLLPLAVDFLRKENLVGLHRQRIQEAFEARANGDFGKEKVHLAEAQKIAANNDLAKLDREARALYANPGIHRIVDLYVKRVMPTLDYFYKLTRGMDPGAEVFHRGYLSGSHFPLLTEEKTAEWVAWNRGEPGKDPPTPGRGGPSLLNTRITKDVFAKRAKGTGRYTDDIEAALSSVLGPRMRNASRQALYDGIVSHGVGYWQGEPPPEGGTAQYKGIIVPIGGGPPKTLMLRSDIYDEVKGVLNMVDRAHIPVLTPTMNVINTIQVAFSPVDLIRHTLSIFRQDMNYVGYGRSMTADLARRANLLTMAATTLGKLTKTAIEMKVDNQPFLEQAARMAVEGTWRPEFKLRGIQRLAFGHHLILYFDRVSRVMADDLFTEMVRRGKYVDTLENRRNYVNKLGKYNRRLAGWWERLFKDTGFARFLEAGRQMPANALELGTGSPQAKTTSKAAAIQIRAIKLAGIVSNLMAPAIINLALNGTPFGRPGTPFGAIDLGYDDKNGKHRIFDPAELMGLRRSGRAWFGINAMVNGIMAGKKAGQILKEMALETAQQYTHGWIGPPPAALSRVVFGNNIFDLRGYTQRAIMDHYQMLENARATLENLSTPLYDTLLPGIEALYKHLHMTMPPETGKGAPGPVTALGQSAGERVGGETGGKAGAYVAHILEGPAKNLVEAWGGTKMVGRDQTAAEEIAWDYNKRHYAEGMTPEQLRKAQLKRGLRNKDPEAEAIAQAMVDSGELTPEERRNMEKAQEANPWTLRIRGLSLPQAVEVLQAANPEEARLIKPFVDAKYRKAVLKNPALARSVAPALGEINQRERERLAKTE